MKKIAILSISLALIGCHSTPEPDVSASVKFKCERYANANVTEIAPTTPAEAILAGILENREKKQLKLKCMRRYL